MIQTKQLLAFKVTGESTLKPPSMVYFRQKYSLRYGSWNYYKTRDERKFRLYRPLHILGVQWDDCDVLLTNTPTPFSLAEISIFRNATSGQKLLKNKVTKQKVTQREGSVDRSNGAPTALSPDQPGRYSLLTNRTPRASPRDLSAKSQRFPRVWTSPPEMRGREHRYWARCYLKVTVYLL
jgi:hypothetical protein